MEISSMEDMEAFAMEIMVIFSMEIMGKITWELTGKISLEKFGKAQKRKNLDVAALTSRRRKVNRQSIQISFEKFVNIAQKNKAYSLKLAIPTGIELFLEQFFGCYLSS